MKENAAGIAIHKEIPKIVPLTLTPQGKGGYVFSGVQTMSCVHLSDKS